MWARHIVQDVRRQADAGRQVVMATRGDVFVSAKVSRADALAVAFDTLAVRVPGSAGELVQHGRAVAARVTYLLEALVLLEVERDRSLLRSVPPRVRQKPADYYELWTQVEEGDVISELCRYRAHRQRPGRESIPMVFTWEVVERLIEDFQAAGGSAADDANTLPH